MESEAKELVSRGLGDYRLVSFEWLEGGSDLLLTLAPPGSEGRKIRMQFFWVTKMRVNLDFGEYTGRPLLHGSNLRSSDGGEGWQVALSFGGAPEGEINFVCNEARILSND